MNLSEYPRPALTVDMVVFSWQAGKLYVLLVQRGAQPFAGEWALPGGFVNIDEPLEAAAARELAEETGLTGMDLEQLHTYGEPQRDPRGRVVTVAYLAVLPPSAALDVHGADDAARAGWFPIDDLPQLAFDHSQIVADAVRHLMTIGMLKHWNV
ncbi:MAG TPA: NUDIX hydrolase [Anaerolineales bacterium]|nr:NUDIX hydrolase [Anaerolineales bacterium]